MLLNVSTPGTAQSARGAETSMASAAVARADWPVYGGEAGGGHFSGLRQITKENVHLLKPAWRFNAGESGGLQTNPLVVDGVVYGYTSKLQVVALDGATGRPKWTFDSGVSGGQPSRGFSWWSDGAHSTLFAYIMNYVYALDAKTGKPVASFGENGRLDLRKDLDSDYTQNSVALTTPGSIYKNLLIVGFRAPETKPAPHGDIRAYDVRTGKLAWTFHTIPHPGEEGYNTWPAGEWKNAGAANNWTGMVVDEKRGIVYVPTGSAVSDFYGADRVGNDLFADTLLALDARTGKKLWHFQGVHHDIWDRDFPSPPVLVTVKHNGRDIDALAQTTKHGFIFVFDRVTGKPLFPIEERPFPASTVPGEKTSPTQPIPLAPEPFARQKLTADMLTTRTPAAHAWAEAEFAKFRGGGLFVPFAVDRQTVVFPGFDGGAEWGGSALDPRAAILYVNANDLPWTGGLTEVKTGTPGSALYATQCAVCHGTNRHGSPPAFPSLVHVDRRLSDTQIVGVLHSGKGRMPAFAALDGTRLQELLDYLHQEPSLDASNGAAAVANAPAAGTTDALGAEAYRQHCALCHGEDRLGGPSNYPALVGVRSRLGDLQILNIVHNGKGRMPAFPALGSTEKQAILRYLGPPTSGENASTAASTRADKQEMANAAAPSVARYQFTGYRKFLDPDGYPAVVPPWGTLNAIDLNTGKYLWRIPLGEYPALAASGMRNTGSENYGGPILTSTGVLFIGATVSDRKLRAFDATTGKLLWEGDLPFSGTATPSTYMVNGKQYIVIATSDARDPKLPQGAAYVAFALP